MNSTSRFPWSTAAAFLLLTACGDDGGASKTPVADAGDSQPDSSAIASDEGEPDAAAPEPEDAGADELDAAWPWEDAAASDDADTSDAPELPACVEADCAEHASCVDSGAGPSCTCDMGYSGSGLSCSDIDECAAASDPCHPSAVCANTEGAFSCSCPPGTVDSGTACITAGELVIAAGQASVTSTAVTLQLQEPHNLVRNPGSETGDLTGWSITEDYGDGHLVSGTALFGTHGLTTSYAAFRRAQAIDLVAAGYSAAELDLAPAVAVREWVVGTGNDVSDAFALYVELRREDDSVIASFDLSDPTTATWTPRGQTFTGYGAGLRRIWFSDYGQDSEFWAGQYGSAFDNASVVLGGSEMRLSNDGTTWSAWTPFAATYPWTLTSGAGTKTVYVEYRDAGGATQGGASDTITLL